jgi:primosomal protein N' (replication factor Y) (superfamily II helicase)
MRYVRISIPKSPIQDLTYSIPDDFSQIEPGMRVLVPLGSRFVTGFIENEEDKPPENFEVRPVADLLDRQNLFSPQLLQLTRWMSEYYLADWSDILKSALPPGLDVKPETLVTITASGEFKTDAHSILHLLSQKKTLPLKKLYELFGHAGTYSQLRMLEEQGLLEVTAARKEKRRGYNMVELIGAANPPTKPKERDIYEFLHNRSSAIWMEDLRAQFKNAPSVIRSLAKQGIVRCFWMPASPRNLWPPSNPVKDLNAAQEQALQKLKSSLGKFGVFLLHGVTGSGKTEVYLRIAKEALERGQSVLILVPEIALLPLIVHRTEQSLRQRISILHSELTERERVEEWQKARRGEARLVIGTRSGIFAPLKNLGLIVLDEEHDSSFKQKEYPRYHARETAIMRAKFEECIVLLGSATPSIESFFNSGNGKYQYLSLPSRIEEKQLPEVHLIDMKEEFRTTGDPVFSRYLLEEISKRLDRKDQVLILQNRRGYASLLMCRECGHVLECPNCSVTLTYHKNANRMRCHYCDYARLAPSRCEECNSPLLHLFGSGTEKIAEALQVHFPEARIERFDRDTTRKRGSISRILSEFAKKEIDILVGTQMLAKGHDFPDVTLVGVVGADSSIGIPDFRSSERLFQLLTQVAGRSGRGRDRGLVILQTFHPDHYAIRCAISQSYEGFYEKEIRFRRLMQYPPYVSLANLVFSGKDPRKTLDEAREFAKLLLAMKSESMRTLGPAIATIARIAGLHRFQILVKSPARKDLRHAIREAIKHYEKKGKRHSQHSIDIDPDSIV